MSKKYVLKSRAGIGSPEERPLEWTEEEYQKFLGGDDELTAEALEGAVEDQNFEYWVEEVTENTDEDE